MSQFLKKMSLKLKKDYFDTVPEALKFCATCVRFFLLSTELVHPFIPLICSLFYPTNVKNATDRNASQIEVVSHTEKLEQQMASVTSAT